MRVNLVLFASPDVVAGNSKQVNDSPSVEVEAPDDSSLKSKDELNDTEDAVATPATVQEQKHSQTLENGDKAGTSSVFFSHKTV
jgi:SWI/SNF related-matrix-associated actin-dependent regulator of chromatin subfamily C